MKKIISENPQLIQNIIDLLSSHMEEDNRKAVVMPLFIGYDRLYSKIDWSGSNRDFTANLVEQLVVHGEIKQDQQALSVVLEALRDDVGVKDQEEIDRCLQLLSPIQDEAIDEPNQVAPTPTKRTTQDASWKYLRTFSLIVMAIALFLFVFRAISPTDNLPQNQEADIVKDITIVPSTDPLIAPTPSSILTSEIDVTETVPLDVSTTAMTSTVALSVTSIPIYIATSTPTAEMTAITQPDPPSVMPTSTATTVPSTPTYQVGTIRLSPTDGANYVYVPKSKFFMGSSDEQIDYALDMCVRLICPRSDFAKEQPQKEIYLDNFWIMQTEVTVEQYGRFMESDGYMNEDYWSEEGWSWKSGPLGRIGIMGKTQPGDWAKAGWNEPQQPVISVTWFEAEAYANWLSSESGLVYKLPTEAQWEKAARGTEAFIFPWGSIWDTEKANSKLKMDGYEQTAPVGSFPAGASPYGALDMAGNVLEWTSDRYDENYYERIDSRGRVNEQGTKLRTVRGGAWNGGLSTMRTTYRYGFAQKTRSNTVGFRLVMLSSDFGE